MNKEQKLEITRISVEFAKGFKDTVGDIGGSGWLIADPLSAYLNALGFNNKLGQLPETDQHPLVLVMTFSGGDKFIPAGSDLKSIHSDAHDYMWL